MSHTPYHRVGVWSKLTFQDVAAEEQDARRKLMVEKRAEYVGVANSSSSNRPWINSKADSRTKQTYIGDPAH